MEPLLVLLILASGLWAGIASVLIARNLEKRGVSVSLLWLRVMIFKYLGQYRKVTLEETGRIGPLFYHYVIPLNVALALVIILLVRRLGG